MEDPVDYYCQFLLGMVHTSESMIASQKAVTAENEAHFTHCDPVYIAHNYVALEVYETAIDYLEEAFEERSFILLNIIKSDSWFDPLRNHHRFIQLLKNMGLNEV